MHPHRTASRLLAVIILAAVGIALLHQHPAWHGAEKLTSCPAAAWHAGAILKSAVRPMVATALLAQPAPTTPPTAAAPAPARSRWSSRAPPLV